MTESNDTPLAAARNKILAHGKTFGVRFDFPLESNRFAARVQVGCDDPHAAAKVREGLVSRIAGMKKELENEWSSVASLPGEEERQMAESMTKMLDDQTIRVSTADDGREIVSIDVNIEMTNTVAAYAWALIFMF